MKNNYLKEFSKWITWMANQVNHVKDEINKEIRGLYTHKIVEINICEKSGKFQIKFTVSGITKPLYFKVLVQEILIDNNTLNCFLPQDIRLITILAMKEYYEFNNRTSFYKVIQQDFDEFGKTLFTIGSSEEIFQKTSTEILHDEELLKNLSYKDVTNIAFTAGYEKSYATNF